MHKVFETCSKSWFFWIFILGDAAALSIQLFAFLKELVDDVRGKKSLSYLGDNDHSNSEESFLKTTNGGSEGKQITYLSVIYIESLV